MSYRVDSKPVDGWTLVHLGCGVATGLLGVPFLLVLAGALFWEAFENWKRPERALKSMPAWTPENDLNVVMDVVAALGGWGVGAALAQRRAV